MNGEVEKSSGEQPDNDQPPHIAVACDIGLSAFARQFPGIVIDINPTAIRLALERINSESDQVGAHSPSLLLFIASTYDRIKSDKNGYPKSVVTSGVLHNSSCSEELKAKLPPTVYVAVDRPPREKQSRKNKSQAEYELKGPTKDLVQALISNHELATRSYGFQRTAIHELRHASEISSPDAIIEHAVYLERIKRHKQWLNVATVLGSASMAAVFGHFNLINTTDSEVLIVSAVAARFCKLQWLSKNKTYQHYREAPQEIRARAAEELAEELPVTIIRAYIQLPAYI